MTRPSLPPQNKTTTLVARLSEPQQLSGSDLHARAQNGFTLRSPSSQNGAAQQAGQQKPAHAALLNSLFNGPQTRKGRTVLPHHHPIPPAIYIHPAEDGSGYLDACGAVVDDPYCARHYGHYQPGMIEAKDAYALFDCRQPPPARADVPIVRCAPSSCALNGCKRADNCLHMRRPDTFKQVIRGMRL